MSAPKDDVFPLEACYNSIITIGGGSTPLPQYNKDSGSIAAPDGGRAGDLFIERYEGPRDEEGR